MDATKVDQRRIAEFLRQFVEAGAWADRAPIPRIVHRFIRALQNQAHTNLAAGEAETIGIPFRRVNHPGKLGLKKT